MIDRSPDNGAALEPLSTEPCSRRRLDERNRLSGHQDSVRSPSPASNSLRKTGVLLLSNQIQYRKLLEQIKGKSGIEDGNEGGWKREGGRGHSDADGRDCGSGK